MKTDLTSCAPARLKLAETVPDRPAKPGTWEERARLLARIEAALSRMDQGRYGLCVACSKRIPLVRLREDPAAASCPECEKSENPAS